MCNSPPKKQLSELGNSKLDIIGGKNCDGVTKTPRHGDSFKIGDITVKSVHTPCHTQDSICYYMEDGGDKAVFTGDTLFISGALPSHQPRPRRVLIPKRRTCGGLYERERERERERVCVC